MALPDIARLASLPDGALRALGKRLQAIGLTPSFAAPVVLSAARIAPVLRRPLRAHHAEKVRHPAAYAMRLLMFGDPIAADEARAALGDLLDPLADAGLVRRRDDGAFDSPFVLSAVDDLYLLSDDLALGADAVMGLAPTTVDLCRAAYPGGPGEVRPIGSALDLGCGAGACALVLSRAASRVVATDINPRAIALARMNVALNGVSNVEIREGDLFAPVAGERFDLVASQPPFVPSPDDVTDLKFMYGGRHGDELSLALLAALPAHLATGGRAVILAEWPEYGETALEERLRRAVGEADLDVLVLKSPSSNLDEHSVSYAAALHPRLGVDFDREARRRRDHFERAGIRELAMGVVVVERLPSGAGVFARTVEVQSPGSIELSSARIDRMLAARRVAADRDRLCAAALRVPEGTVLTQEQVGPGADVPSTIAARFAPQALVRPIQMTPDLLGLVTLVHESASVAESIELFAEAYEVSVERARETVLASVERALLYGLLEVGPPPADAAHK